jgi:uncharacterized protein (DUF2235 family)
VGPFGREEEVGMKRLVVCTDGTWNSRDAAKEDGSGLTNVAKLERAIAAEDARGVRQHSFYHAGVGVGPWYEKMLGGAFGVGLSRNVQQCYSWLVEMYEPGDQIFLFGFSRGAYTARSLVGLVRNCGLLQREHRARVAEAYTLYRDRDPKAHPNADKAAEFRTRYAHQPRVHCIGVWDTVGALGVPTSGPVGWFTREKYGFHDVRLSGQVDHAFHALAIDERRKPFAPTLWEIPDADLKDPARTQRVEQVWFAGVHSDVGGGYSDCTPSDAALLWMMDRAEECGLALKPEARKGLEAKCDASLHDSMSTFYRAMGVYERAIRDERRDRDGTPIHTFEDVHDSVFERRRRVKPPYEPSNLKRYVDAFGERVKPPAAPTASVTPGLADVGVRAPDGAPGAPRTTVTSGAPTPRG